MKECNQCGKCCIKYSDDGLFASEEEIAMWALFHPEIHQYVAHDGKIWVEPTTGSKLKVCPFLEQIDNQNKYTCSIYHERPEDCRHYPTHISEMQRDECEMIEVVDLNNLTLAQYKLDKLMADSRPAYKK